MPAGCTSVDVFLVGGGGGSNDMAPGGGGYTKTFKKDTSGWKDGNEVSVYSGQSISIVVGKGGTAGNSIDTGSGTINTKGGDGGYSQFMNSNYRANGGIGGYVVSSNSSQSPCGDGGSGASARHGGSAGSDGSDGSGYGAIPGTGQGHTTRDFGESTGKRNAGGGRSYNSGNAGGASDYSEGTGGTARGNYMGTTCWGWGGGGYGGGAGGVQGTCGSGGYSAAGGDGTVLIRYYGYK